MEQMFIEHIARHADIDTRRAMGFPPRKLVLPDLNLDLSSRDYIDYEDDVSRFVKVRGARLYISSNVMTWCFGDPLTCRTYSFRRDGRISYYALLVMKHSQHPDLNEDGTPIRS